MPRIYIYLFLSVACQSLIAEPASNPMAMKEDHSQISQWNKFSNDLVKLHHQQIQDKDIEIITTSDGYANQVNFYQQKLYYDKTTGQLLSRVQRETDKPGNIHLIEVYLYNQHGQLTHDYMAAFLPEHRNAPIQTLVNLHYNDNELQSYRQFDASGNRIYEQCKGRYFESEVMISLEEHEIPRNGGTLPASITDDLYLACFNQLPSSPGHYLSPSNLVNKNSTVKHLNLVTYEALEKNINLYTTNITNNPNNAINYIKRGQLYFDLHEFQQAIDDMNNALQLDDNQDEAYFWRGMALARDGQIDAGISDLSIYLERNPTSSLGYTKRGVRYIWKGDLKQAELDLRRAIQLDNNNAEAHDDIGVIHAQRGDIKTAIKHFTTTLKIDPSYQKAWHNLATAEFINTNYEQALNHVNQSITLLPGSKNSLLLKGEILMALGRTSEAKKIIDDAEFLPDGNWSEQWSKN